MNNLIKDIKLIINNTKLLICLICTIIAVCVLGGTYRYNIDTDNKGMVVGVVNNDESPYADLLLNFFKSNESFSQLANIVEDNQTTIETEFESGNIDAYIVIPKDFANSLMDLENTRIKIRINQEKEVEAIILKAVLSSYEKYVTSVQNNAVGLYSSLKKSGLKRKENMKINLLSSWQMVNMAMAKEDYFDYKVVNVKKISLVEHYIYTIILIIIIYYGIYVGVQIKYEQSKGVLKLYKVGKGNMLSFILSKISVNGIFICILLSIPIMIICNNIGDGTGANVIAFIILNIIMYISVAILFALVINNKNTYILIVNGLVILLTIVGGGIIPYEYMPQNMQVMVKYLPIKLFEEQFNDIVKETGNVQYMTYISICFICIIISAFALGRSKEYEKI